MYLTGRAMTKEKKECPLTLPSPRFNGERIKVRGPKKKTECQKILHLKNGANPL